MEQGVWNARVWNWRVCRCNLKKSISYAVFSVKSDSAWNRGCVAVFGGVDFGECFTLFANTGGVEQGVWNRDCSVKNIAVPKLVRKNDVTQGLWNRGCVTDLPR